VLTHRGKIFSPYLVKTDVSCELKVACFMLKFCIIQVNLLEKRKGKEIKSYSPPFLCADGESTIGSVAEGLEVTSETSQTKKRKAIGSS